MSYRILDINDNGWTSGQMMTDEVPYAAVVFTPDGTPIDLNALAPLPSEDGYYMRGGHRISDNGVVVGQAYNPLTDQYRNYRYIPAALRDTIPVSEILPDTGSRNPKVNSFGDVACLIPDTETVRVYFLDSTIEPWVPEVQGVRAISGFNDQFQLLYLGPWAEDGNAILYKYTPGAQQQSFYLHTVARLNNYGTIVARSWATNLRSGNHVSYSDEGEASVILEKADGYPTGINDAGEIIGWAGQRNLSNYDYFPSLSLIHN